VFTLNVTIGKRTLAWLLAGLLAATTLVVANHADAGASPPGEGIARVYVAVGTGFPDALGVGPGAAANGAPIILVPTNPPLNPATEAELIRLDPREVVIVGGTAVISLATEAALVALLPNAAFSRIAGSNRYVTNADFSASVFPIEGWVSVPAAAFTTDNPDTDVTAIGMNNAFSTGGGILQAPIHLPHGAEILEVRAWFYDADGVDDVQACLRQFDSVVTEAIACVSSSESDGDILASTTAIAQEFDVVDNSLYGYMIYVTGAKSLNLKISRVLVRYELGVTG
jgi:ell wall binding domain 2 (CWB2)